MNLTKKQKQVYDFISDYIKENGYSPSQVEIQIHFGFKSLGSVQDYIRYLTKSGHLTSSGPNTVRGLSLTHTEDSSSTGDYTIPLVGKVAAGLPIEAIEYDSPINVPPSMLKSGNEHFALLVEGESMIDDGIFDGDTLIIKKQSNAHQGETVIALIDNHATVKRYYKRRDKIELHPANQTMQPIVVDQHGGEFSIAGVVVGLLRTFP